MQQQRAVSQKKYFSKPDCTPSLLACIHRNFKFTSWFSVPESKLPSESFPLCKPVAMWHHQLEFINIFYIPVSAIKLFSPLSHSTVFVSGSFHSAAMAFSCGRSKTNFLRRWPRASCLLRELFVTVVLLINISFEAFFINIDMRVILPCAWKEERMNLDDLDVPGRRRMQAAC